MLFLVGGPSHIDTWDPKPDAPAEVRGPFKAVDTRAPGMRITEIFPRLAQLADKFSPGRSATPPATAAPAPATRGRRPARLSPAAAEPPPAGRGPAYLKGPTATGPPTV